MTKLPPRLYQHVYRKKQKRAPFLRYDTWFRRILREEKEAKK